MKDILKLITSFGILAGIIIYAGFGNQSSDAGQESGSIEIASVQDEKRPAAAPAKVARTEQSQRQAQATRTAITKRFVVYFDFDSARVSPRSQKIIRQALEFARTVKATHVSLSGFADRAGPAGYNMKLSERRAGVVAATLKNVDAGVERLDVKAFGEERLAVHTPDGKAHKGNRRVEIIVTA